MNDLEARIILLMADCDMKITEVAKVMYVHRNTVVYHIDKIKRKTGLNPTKFYDLCELVKMVGGNNERKTD